MPEKSLTSTPHLTKKGTTVRNMRMFCLKLAKELIFGRGDGVVYQRRNEKVSSPTSLRDVSTLDYVRTVSTVLELPSSVWKQCREAMQRGN